MYILAEIIFSTCSHSLQKDSDTASILKLCRS